MKKHLIGRPVPRKEGRAKVTGQARYVDDLVFPGMLYGATVRSRVARGRIKGISFSEGIPWHEFTIVTAKDIPGENYVALIAHDQPYLADGVVNHSEEPVVLLAHPEKYLLEEARRAVQLEIEPQRPTFTIEDSLNKKEIIWGEDNVFKSYSVEKGNVDGVWARADFIVEGEYRTGAQEQLYIETNGMIAIANGTEGVTVWGSMQCPYYVHKALLKLFGLTEEKVRVIQTETGGGFGGKEEYPSLIAGHAALLSWKSGKPVKIVYDRAEDMAATTKRHPSRTRHRTAVSKDGKLLGMEIDFVIDGGAYTTLSPVVLSRGTIHAPGPYFCPNVRIRSRAVATNAPPHGAFRGFGAPQSIFALERHLNRVARAIGLTPEEFRLRNFIQPGQTTATGQVIRENVDMNHLLERALALDYDSIEILKPDTASVPNSGPTVASRTCMVVGKLVEAAALGLQQTLVGSGYLPEGYTPAGFERACKRYIESHGPLKSSSQYQPPPGIHWDDATYYGDAYGTYAWAVYVAEVTVDTVTFEIEVNDFVAVQEVGKVIHPVLAAGQIEGGVAQAIGYALYENVVWNEGRMFNSQMTNYIMPTAVDVPPIRVFFEELPYSYGPAGAKGLGELPMDGAAPAIVNAIENATGVSIHHIPVMPESLMEALAATEKAVERA